MVAAIILGNLAGSLAYDQQYADNGALMQLAGGESGSVHPAHELARIAGCDQDVELFDGAEKSYRKVGRSRKKIQGYTMTRRPGEQGWLDAVRAEEARLSAEAEFAVVPSIRVETLAWCRFVDIVAPVEVRSVAELRGLADLVRRILRGETTLEREFPGYVYGKAQWVGEGMAERPLSVVSHRIAGT